MDIASSSQRGQYDLEPNVNLKHGRTMPTAALGHNLSNLMRGTHTFVEVLISLCALPHQQIAGPKYDRARLLFLALHGDKAHRRPLSGLADRFGVGGIVLRRFTFDIGWRYQANRVAELADLTRPIMRTAQAPMATRQAGCLAKNVSTLPRRSCLRKTTAPEASAPCT